MHDIAKIAGVSQSTVSRVLNDAPPPVTVAPDTRTRVLAAAAYLDFRPNPAARALRGAPTMLIGVIVQDFSDPFFATAIQALAVEAMDLGYNVVLGHAHGRSNEGVSLTSVLETRHTDAIILLGEMRDQPRVVADLRRSAVPVVALWQGSSPLAFPTVDVDDRAGIEAGLDHLLERGHQRIAFVSAPLGDTWQRQRAFIELMRDRDRPILEGYVRQSPNTLAGGEQALRALMSLHNPPTAIMTATDFVGVGVLHAAFASGRQVPRDLSVVGFDDLSLAAHSVPALTTLRMPLDEIVSDGLRLAIELSRDPDAPRTPRLISYRPTLIIRDSTGRPSVDPSDPD